MIRLAKPSIPEEAIEKVVEVLRSGDLVQGRYVEAFEASLQEYLDVKHAVVVSSGTAALHLSLLASGVGENDEVIVPAFTFPATANVVELVGARPVLVDISLDDFCIDASKIETAITPKTKAIISVHEFGQAAEMDKILQVSNQFGLEIIEDAACALGTEFDKQKVGTFGRVGCFSFHPRKAITTGEGGVVVTNDDELAQKMRSLRNHGICYSNGKQDFRYAGLNYRMADFQAALGLYQIKEIEELNKKRITLAKEYDEKLADMSWIKTPATFNNRTAIYQTYHVVVDDRIDREDLIGYLKDNAIETNLGAQALNCLHYYRRKYSFKDMDFANADTAFKQGLALPIGNHLESDDFLWIVKRLKEYKAVLK